MGLARERANNQNHNREHTKSMPNGAVYHKHPLSPRARTSFVVTPFPESAFVIVEPAVPRTLLMHQRGCDSIVPSGATGAHRCLTSASGAFGIYYHKGAAWL